MRWAVGKQGSQTVGVSEIDFLNLFFSFFTKDIELLAMNGIVAGTISEILCAVVVTARTPQASKCPILVMLVIFLSPQPYPSRGAFGHFRLLLAHQRRPRGTEAHVHTRG